MGWLWFLIALFPVSGISQAGDQSVADRFTYLPHMGLFVALVWPAANRLASLSARRAGGFSLTGLLLLFALLTWFQTAYWRNGHVFWRHALLHQPGHPLLEFRLGLTLAEELGRPDEAIPHLQRAVEAAPTNVPFVAYLGIAQLRAGRREEASYFIEAARLNGRGSMAFDYLEQIGDLLLAQGEFDRAGAFYESALATSPDFTDSPARRAGANLNLGLIRYRQGRPEEGERLLARARAEAPALARDLCAGEGLRRVPADAPGVMDAARRVLCDQK
jgi:tetratricopeptide (TPR) repeat protein